MFDTLIRGALLFDGKGTPPRRADVGCREGKIAAIGDLASQSAERTFQADGLWLTPGFIDLHTHYDLELEVAPGLSESVRHGVTTVVVGNCSLSATVGSAQDLADLFQRVETLPASLIRSWLTKSQGRSSPQAYLEHLESLPLGPRVAPLVGHSTLRTHVMGLDRAVETEPAPEALFEMARHCLELGYLGISVDRMPWHLMSGRHRGKRLPSHMAPFSECEKLADLCRRHEAVMQMTPNPQARPSIARLLLLCTGGMRRPLRATIVGAFDVKAMPQLWRLWPVLLYVMNRWLGANLRLQTLPTALTMFSDGPVTALFDEFPAGARLNDCADRETRQRLLADPVFRKQFRGDWENRSGRTFHRDFRLIFVGNRSLAEIAGHRDPLECFLDLLQTHDTDLRWHTTLSNDRKHPLHRLLNDPFILPGIGDSGAHLRNFAYNDGALSLLAQDAMPAERAVHRVTGETAEWLGLETGTIEVGRPADWVLLRPEHLKPSRMLETESGSFVNRREVNPVETVAIGGRVAVENGEPVKELGRVKMGSVLLRRPRPAPERFRVAAKPAPHRLATYWEVFVMKHQSPANVALHCLGVVLMLGIPLLALGNPLWLCVWPISQLVGLLGHLLFERSPIDRRDAVFSPRAVLCLLRLFYRVVSGRYFDDVNRIASKLSWLVFLGLAGSASALQQDFAAIFENDHPRVSLWGTDRGYSSGVGFYYGRTSESTPPLALGIAKALSVIDSGEATTSSWALGIGQQIYTPDDINNRNLIATDRPYAAWLYASILLNLRTPRTLHSLTVEAGMVGPAALGRQTQNFIHSATGVRQALGWDNQLSNEPGLLVAYRQRARVWEFFGYGSRLVDVAPAFTLALGNLATYAALGGRVRFGYGLAENFGPPGLEAGAASYAPFGHRETPDASFEISGFAGYGGRVILRDLFLDGNTFTSSHRIERRYWMLEFEAGLVLRIAPWTFTWRYTQSTTAFDADRRYQFVGAAQFQIRF